MNPKLSSVTRTARSTAAGFGAHGVGKVVQHKLTGHSSEYSARPGEHHPHTGEPVAVGTVDPASTGALGDGHHDEHHDEHHDGHHHGGHA